MSSIRFETVSVDIAFWQQKTHKNLNTEDARQIKENLEGFFSLLNEWQKMPYNNIFNVANNKRHHDMEVLLMSLLPFGKREGQEYVALNPTRHDNKQGSFSVNLISGKWADFATGDSGGDIVSL